MNVELFGILRIPAQLTELKNYKYMQYVGTSPAVAILSSFIHYSLIKKFDLFTKLILEFGFYTQYSKSVQKHLQLSHKALNPVKEFFEYFLQDKKKENTLEEFTMEFFQGMNWLDGKTVNLSKIANKLRVTIQILPDNKRYGTEDQQKIIIFSEDEKFFNFIIPHNEIFETFLINCSQCRKSCRSFCYSKCGHMNYCLKCIEKIQYSTYIRCEKCYQNTIKSYFTIQLENIEYKKKMSDLLTRYYENTVLQQVGKINKVQISLDQSITKQKQEVQQKKNQVEPEYKQQCERCYQYEDLISHFSFPKCDHTFCYQCLKKCLNFPSLNEVKCLMCFQSCHSTYINNYNQFYESAYQQPPAPPQCAMCKKTSKYDLFKNRSCEHTFCFDCVNQNVDITKNPYAYTPCLIKTCISSLEFNQCLNYVKKINSAQIEETQKELMQNAQKSQVLDQCQNCKDKFPYKLFEVNFCKHKFCFKCLNYQKNNQKENFCLYSCCTRKYQQTELQDYIKQLQQYSKQGQVSEAQEQQLKLENSKKILIQEVKPDQLAQTLEKVKSVSQKIEYQADQTINPNTQLKIEPDKTTKKASEDIKKQDDIKNQDHSDESTKNSLPSNDASLPKKDSKEDFNLDSTKNPQVDNKNGTSQKTENQFQNLAIIKWVEEDSIDDIVVEQIAQFDKQEQEETKGQCSNCCQDFSIYNRKQNIECNLHKIGVCCITIKFDKCPQCERVYTKPISKKKLQIEKIKPGIDFMFEDTLPHPSKIYQPPELDKTLTRYNDYRNMPRSTATDLIGSQRFSSVDTRLIQQQRRVEPRKENYYYEPPMIQSHQPVIMSRQPQFASRLPPSYDLYNRRQVY